jgi:hypothetical protein
MSKMSDFSMGQEGRLHAAVPQGPRRFLEAEHLIDLDADPFVGGGLMVEVHQKGGSFKWDASKVSLYLSEPQKKGKWTEGNKLREYLAGKPVLNTNVLDYLLGNPHLIPEEWKGKYVFFLGNHLLRLGWRRPARPVPPVPLLVRRLGLRALGFV